LDDKKKELSDVQRKNAKFMELVQLSKTNADEAERLVILILILNDR
jgi:hypothetical protein